MNKSIRFFMICLLMAMVLAGCATKPVIDEAKQKEIDAFYEKVDRVLRDRNFNGSVLVAKDDIIYLAKGYGLSEENTEIKNQRETIYQIGSITKSFTAMAIMQLLEAGKLNVQDPIDKYFPNYPNDSKITIHHLLTHTSGFDQNPISLSEFNELLVQYNGILDKNMVTELMGMVASKPLLFEPGTKFDYNSHGYRILGAIIEIASGQSYGTYIEENICKPLGLQDTGYNERNVLLEGQAVGFDRSWIEHVPITFSSASGGLHSTIDDLYTWTQAIKTNKLISRATTRKMLHPFLAQYAYGWYVDQKGGFTHTGTWGGYRSLVTVDAVNDYTIIIL
ncbi:MAG: beta-lactamase family protein, partial [Spirochaetes bacterium]|nr:beta-lactamase family protein [Spirochaetota bacterium]MBU0956817.1 beta-lactamase family protein [Spirochaetota bacterium]